MRMPFNVQIANSASPSHPTDTHPKPIQITKKNESRSILPAMQTSVEAILHEVPST